MDSHMYGGYEIPPFYDSLLGKLVVWGEDRPAAIERARVALDELVLDGVITNVDFHRALMDSRPFLDGAFTYMGLSIWGLASWRKLQLEAERPPCITGRTRRSRG